MSDIGKCEKCGCVIAYRFPIHVCKSIKVFDGNSQTLIKKITIEQREAELKALRKIYNEVDTDIDGDIVFFSESEI